MLALRGGRVKAWYAFSRSTAAGSAGSSPASSLAELEQRAGKPVAEMFDLIAGTSTGGILALALARPGEDGRPAWSASTLVELYEQEGPGSSPGRSLIRSARSAG